ncbi:hypothetical protein CEXT_32531 [Caerostris extrusa]|uniref:Uncharacterized protein n=1 Tax=Caerostris extrusa TaxID=172846 RepID=A0AAV4V9J8_CAEEX|nr:hypothetical protein CEXT_32531 [Caerostris extrusa]
MVAPPTDAQPGLNQGNCCILGIMVETLNNLHEINPVEIDYSNRNVMIFIFNFRSTFGLENHCAVYQAILALGKLVSFYAHLHQLGMAESIVCPLYCCPSLMYTDYHLSV